MNTINKLLDKARETCKAKSDAKVAEKIKVSRQTMSKWRKDELRITDEHLALLIEIANADETIFAKVREEKAETATERRIWKSMLERLTETATTLIAGAGVSSSNESYASIGNKEELKQPDKLVGRAGIEPATSGLKVRASGKE
ncbi:DUF3693 domain-containing protein [Xylella fastidiosa subsp. multiplex]|uniref:DUF3693 domain-containing protein n=1 Tax=Xylella fastidiosa TaxID=2371 RepID=UPI00235EFF4C|nr:DUF3693 domain-containing protein [Xylella fastidiosa]MDD0927334.1 DUF3693 domain-containing protein [Xylella fastidiosa subsp. multiplex]